MEGKSPPVVSVLLVALVVATTYWQTWASAGLADRQDNSIQRVAQFKIKRGQGLKKRLQLNRGLAGFQPRHCALTKTINVSPHS